MQLLQQVSSAWKSSQSNQIFNTIFLILSAGTGAGTGFMTPYGAYATLPQQGAFNGLSPYQNAAAQQEARLQ